MAQYIVQRRSNGDYISCLAEFDDSGSVWIWARDVQKAYAFRHRSAAKECVRTVFRIPAGEVTFRQPGILETSS